MEKIFNSDMFMLCLCIAVGVFALISIVSLVLLIVTMVKLKNEPLQSKCECSLKIRGTWNNLN